MKKIEITTLDDLNTVLSVCRSMFEAQGKLTVSVKKFDRNISDEQRRLYWMWIGIIGNEIGNGKDEQHEHYKERFLLNIYIHDTEFHPGFADMAASIRAIKEDNPQEYKHIRAQVIRMVSITTASVKNMTEYLKEIESDARSLNIVLPMPEFQGLME